jgi:hypothetical protein
MARSVCRLSTRLVVLIASVALVIALLDAAAHAAPPQFGIASLSTSASTTQAGAHGDFSTSFAFNTESLGNPVEQVEQASIVLPRGVIANPQAAEACTLRTFEEFKCAHGAQVGVLNTSLVVCQGVETTLGVNGVGEVEPTTLTAPAEPGEASITVATTAGIRQGDYLQIGSEASVETVIVKAVTDGTHLAIYQELLKFHAAGETVGDDTITVASTSSFCAAEPNNIITVGTGATAETARIAYVDDATHLVLTAPLKHAHPTGEPVRHVAETATVPIPLFNLKPTPGHIATFGASFLIASIYIQVDVRSDGQLTATINGISTMLPMREITLTLWGVPADASHDPLRCDQLGFECGPSQASPKAFMTNPTYCTGTPGEVSLTTSSWQGHSATRSALFADSTGCEYLRMSPQLAVSPDSRHLNTPAGYEFNLLSPQEATIDGLGTATIRNVSITLPEGVSLSPALANGLQACSDAQFAGEGCPASSKMGTAEVVSPLLAKHLTGSVYIGSPTPTEKYRLFIRISSDGAELGLRGRIELNGSTGQVTAIFNELPPLPFSDFKLSFFGGPGAAFANPTECGRAISTAQITSYGGQVASLSSAFEIESGDVGSLCSSSLPFAPSFNAGSISPVAGGFSPVTFTVSSEDGQQPLASIMMQLPPGLLGMLAAVPLCDEPQASAGSCAESSRIGTATIGAGPGTALLHVSGPVYLTGPYRGAPFGLSIAVPAIAGPFNLGTIVTRARISISPADLHLTIASDPLPQIAEGVPLRLHTLSLTIDRAGFTFNPSNCSTQSVTATIGGSQGATATVSSPFQVLGCGSLPFAPEFSAATQAKAGRLGDGASLNVKVTNTSRGENIKSMRIQLPVSLRPRFTAIQLACPPQEALAGLASCPQHSQVGSATMQTPMLPVPLTGPIYLRSRGGTAQPVLQLALKGDGLEVELTGMLDIVSKNVIRAEFKALPDVPFSSFEIDLPEGPHSILGATGSLCVRPVLMPYMIDGQDGRHLQKTVRVSVAGCHARRKKSRRVRGRRLG